MIFQHNYGQENWHTAQMGVALHFSVGKSVMCFFSTVQLVTMETVLSVPPSLPPPFPFTDDSGDEEPASQSDKSELHSTLKNLSSKLEDLSTCNDLIAKHGAALQRSLSELENLKLPAESGEKIKAVNERATLFRITSNAMINVSGARLLVVDATQSRS